MDGSEDSAQYTSDNDPYMTHEAIRHFIDVLGSFKEENAPKLMDSQNWAEAFVATFYLEKGIKPTLLNYIELENTAPTPGILEIV